MVPRPVFRAAGVVAMLVVLAVILYESSQARGQPGVLELTNQAPLVLWDVVSGDAGGHVFGDARFDLFAAPTIQLTPRVRIGPR